MTQWIQDHSSYNKLQIFSRGQKDLVQGPAGCMEHAVPTREMISHGQIHRKNLYMVQIDFSDAFDSVPDNPSISNMVAMGIPPTATSPVGDICTNNSSKISLIGGDTPLIHGQVA
jgi:hypothetical protein